MKTSSKFIILRGPSGAGKSTVAKKLHEGSKRKIVLIEQDYYREKLINDGIDARRDSKSMRLEMLEADVLIALKHDYDVILEGIFRPEEYVPLFERIVEQHPHENYMFYFDVTFEETLKRHASREKAEWFDRELMQTWYDAGKKAHLDWETVIPETSDEASTIDMIRKATGI